MHGNWGYGFNNMMNFGNRINGWFMVYNMVKLLIIIVVVIVLARMLMKNSRNQNNSNSNNAIEILKERYAKGEIDEAEYENKLNRLNE